MKKWSTKAQEHGAFGGRYIGDALHNQIMEFRGVAIGGMIPTVFIRKYAIVIKMAATPHHILLFKL